MWTGRLLDLTCGPMIWADLIWIIGFMDSNESIFEFGVGGVTLCSILSFFANMALPSTLVIFIVFPPRMTRKSSTKSSVHTLLLGIYTLVVFMIS